MNRSTFFLTLTVAALVASGVFSSASAQQIVARVNGDPITAVDVAQRTRLHQVSGSKATTRQGVIDELIDEQLKIQAARRYRIEIPNSDVDRVVRNMAARMRASPEQFAKALGSAGISINALRRKLRADLAWSNIVRGKFQASLQVREKDVDLALQQRQKGDTKGYVYTLHPILLVVPRGAGDAAFAARRREADGLRARFQNCEDGMRLARGMRDVAVRPPIIRAGADVSGKQREVLEATKLGHLTPPDITPSGIELFAVCERKEAGTASSGAERDVRDQLFGERFQEKGTEYLRQLRRSAAIELR